MYKILLYDQNCGGGNSGVYEMFVENLEDFERHWKFQGEEQEERYLKSKAGEFVTDYYCDHPDLNIVQCDTNAEILETKELEKENIFFELFNFFGCGSNYFAQKIKITLYHVRFGELYYLLGGYSLSGVCTEVFFSKGTTYETVTVWGNPVLKQEISPEIVEYNKGVDKKRMQLEKEWDIIEEQGGEPDYSKNPRYFQTENHMDFSGCNLETFCLITLNKYDNKDECSLESMSEITKELIEELLQDIPGEGG